MNKVPGNDGVWQRRSRTRLSIGCAALAAGFMVAASPAMAVDWSAVEGKSITLFSPGQASFEWVMTQTDHSGAGRFREGRNCMHCHDGEQKDIGNLIVAAEGRGARLEPKPMAAQGKPGTIDLDVKTAHDDERLYIQLKWNEVTYGGDKMDPDNAARVTVMLDDGTVREATRAGCWGACHDDAIGMASAQAGADLTKYLFASRSSVARSGGGENHKPDAEIQDLLAKGMYLEYWQARLNHGQPAKAVEGYILDKRHETDVTQVSADAQFADGAWTVVLSRPLKAGNAQHKDIVAGKSYNVGFAVHNHHTDHRFHHVSLEYTLALDQGDASLIAKKQ
jgi:cytochrome c-type protein NapC